MNTQPDMSAAQIKQVRTEYNFKRKHGQEGFDRFMAMAYRGEYVESFAEEFGITRARASQLLGVILGEPYSIWLAKHNVNRKVGGAK